jgi:hypothetical protein
MTMETILALAFAGSVGLLVWALIMLERLHKVIEALSSSLADVADGRATIYRYNGRIIVTHTED